MANPRNNLIILGLVVVLIGAAAYLIFIRQPVAESTRLGLDLEGGVTANLQGYKTDGSEVTQQEMDVAAGVIRQRVDSLGVTEPEIQLQGQDQVVVNIPGITDADRAVEVIGRTAQLGFYEVLASAGGQPVPEDEIESTKEELQAALDSATLARDQQGRREVQMELTSEGAEGFGELSQEIVDDALANGRPGRGQLAVVLDEDVVSAPVVEQPIYGGQVSINNQGLPGGLPQKEAEELEVVLQTGALPVNMEVLSVTSIGPTLGSDSLRSGLLASLVGFGLVLVFLIYAFLLWGLIVAIPITLTLPGLAGIVLSIGVAADANVVIFERIKEEIRRGKSPRTAVGLGYQKGFA